MDTKRIFEKTLSYSQEYKLMAKTALKVADALTKKEIDYLLNNLSAKNFKNIFILAQEKVDQGIKYPNKKYEV